MVILLHNLKPAKGSQRKRKRVGRGNASGHGTYSTRGLKGQRSRSGGKSGLKKLGFKQTLQGVPKHRGFKSAKPDNQPVNLSEVNKFFKDNDTIDSRALLKAGLIKKIGLPIKILGLGELKLKNLTFVNIKASQPAKEQIEKSGGKITNKA
jgi:large subunit ribosomal protein L15